MAHRHRCVDAQSRVAVDVVRAVSGTEPPPGCWVLVCTAHVDGKQRDFRKNLIRLLLHDKKKVGVDWVYVDGAKLEPFGYGSMHISTSRKILVSPSVFLYVLKSKGISAPGLFLSLDVCEVWHYVVSSFIIMMWVLGVFLLQECQPLLHRPSSAPIAEPPPIASPPPVGLPSLAGADSTSQPQRFVNVTSADMAEGLGGGPPPARPGAVSSASVPPFAVRRQLASALGAPEHHVVTPPQEASAVPPAKRSLPNPSGPCLQVGGSGTDPPAAERSQPEPSTPAQLAPSPSLCDVRCAEGERSVFESW